MSRPLVATIDLAALRHNYLLSRRVHGGKMLAVLKANGYGHGAVACAQALSNVADGFAVAAIEEALQLRAAGIQQPILLLEGWFEANELAVIEQQQLWTALHSMQQLSELEAAQLSQPLTVWLKIDSGMHRLGLALNDTATAYRRLQASGKVGQIVLSSHFACADETGNPMTPQQISAFQQAIAGLDAQTSLANSAGIHGWPDARSDWGRLGIGLYGGKTLDRPLASPLKPVMNLDSRVIAIRELPAGEPIGYGARYHCSRPSRVGVVACGYADGYPRLAPAGTPVLVDGQRTVLIGRVSMDMLTIDLTDLPTGKVGSDVRLWGEGLPCSEIAEAAGTIDYELFCNVKRARLDYRSIAS